MKLRYKSAYFIILLFSSFVLKSQETVKVVKIDNSKYPFIEIFIRADETINPDEINIIENNKTKEINTDRITSKEIQKGRSLLFILKNNSNNKIISSVIKIFQSLQTKDKINLGFILNSDTSKNIIHFTAPDFSYNHEFFINILEQNLYQSIEYKMNRQAYKNTKTIERKLFNTDDGYYNKAVIFISETLRVKPEPCSKLLKNSIVPTYIILTEEISEAHQKDLINICTKTGGIYTVIKESDLVGKLNFYLEDISLNESQKKSELYRVTFKTEQNKAKNIFKLVYKDESKNYLFTTAQISYFSSREYFLMILSGFLLIIIFVFSFKRKSKTGNKDNAILKDPIIKSSIVKPIEINVKTEGFTKTYFFEKHIIRIGRSSDNDVIIPDRTVSSTHAVINKEGESYIINDVGSTNGIKVNQILIKKQELKSKDKIKMGAAILIVQF